MNFPAEILPGFDCRFFIGVGNQSGFYNTLEHNPKIQEFFMSEQKKIKVAVIAAGSRARLVVKNLLRDSERNVVIASVFDPDQAVMEEAILQHWNSPEAKRCRSSEEAINTPGVEWVMIFSPNAYHKEHILQAFAAGKHVFTEKPLATSIEDCQEIFEAYQKAGKLFATGFVLRYAPIYRKAYEILNSGKIGRLIALEANENIVPDHGGYIMCNWRRLKKLAGPHILEKCCHDLDLINWFCNSLPSRVAAFGGRDFFRPENRNLEEKYGVKTFKSWWDPHTLETPFNNDTDLMDNMVSIAEFRNGIRTTFTATMSNRIPERRMRFNCTEGTMCLDLYTGILRYRNLADEGVTEIVCSGDGHGGGDDYIMKELYESMTKGVVPKCSGNEGLQSAVYALSLDRAAVSGEVVNLEPIWKSLHR